MSEPLSPFLTIAKRAASREEVSRAVEVAAEAARLLAEDGRLPATIANGATAAGMATVDAEEVYRASLSPALNACHAAVYRAAKGHATPAEIESAGLLAGRAVNGGR